MEDNTVKEIAEEVRAQNQLIRSATEKLMERWKTETKGLKFSIKTCIDKIGNPFYMDAGSADLSDINDTPYSVVCFFYDALSMDDLRDFLLKYPEYIKKAKEIIQKQRDENNTILNWFKST